MSYQRIKELESELYQKQMELNALRREAEPVEVRNYSFTTLEGKVSLLELFGDKETLFLIHNMGSGCRYCTLWADGLNAFLPHLESQFAIALVSKNSPLDQRRMANDRGWRFRMASHGGGEYIEEQSLNEEGSDKNYPGLVCYVRKKDTIFRKNRVTFGPGDEFCSIWNILSLAGFDDSSWTPQFHYWHRPEKMEDGGKNIF